MPKWGKKLKSNKFRLGLLLALIPIFISCWVWLSPLAFVPVPWPDDSAFYFVAKELFKWPPRWVMLPQAPFEPTYSIFNFNTMPLYPILIGLGRWIGIDGSFLLKIWPLSAWALTGSLLVVVLYQSGLHFTLSALIAFAFALDPELRWASVLVRPESLIGLFGMSLILGLTFGFPKKLKPTRFWDPVAALLALGAYAHFNAVHLVIPVIFALSQSPLRLFQIGLKTTLYLTPWIIAVLVHLDLFIKQMQLQWSRLALPNHWLSSVHSAVNSLFQELGSPENFHPSIFWAAMGLWVFIGVALVFGVGVSTYRSFRAAPSKQAQHQSISLLPASGWIVGAIWIWHTKPEVWFIYYLHVAIWAFVGITFLKLWMSKERFRLPGLVSLGTLTAAITLIFGFVDLHQAQKLGATQTWNWPTYYQFVDCIDQRLTQLEKNRGPGKQFRVWDPTFPDVTIELNRRHPHWEFTRTNDFHSRGDLAVAHGWETEAVVVTETLNWAELTVSENAENIPELLSVWMRWEAYFLNRLWKSPGWKPNRYICQRGRWQAFLFMADEKPHEKTAASSHPSP